MNDESQLVTRPTFLRRAPIRISILYSLAIYFFFGSVIVDLAMIKIEFACFSLIFMTRIVNFLVESRTTNITVTDRGTILKRGLIFRRTKTIFHEDISSIDVIQKFFDQNLNVGTIKILATGKRKVEISVEGISAPHKLKAFIESMR